MGKNKDKAAATKDLNTEYNYQQNQRANEANRFDPQIQQFGDQAAESRNQYTGALSGLSDVGNQFLGTNIQADTGALSGDSAAYKNFASGQGETGQFFRNLMNTGGYSESELGDIRSAGNRQIPSFFANLRDRMRTQNNANGGYSPGYSSGNAAMARDAAHQGQEAALDTELGISDRVRQGKLTGAGNLNQMFLGGMGGATNADTAAMNAKLQAQGLTLQGQGMGANLMSNVAQGYGNLNQQDINNEMQSEILRMKQQGMSDDRITQLLQTRFGTNTGASGMEKAKLGASVAVPIIVAI